MKQLIELNPIQNQYWIVSHHALQEMQDSYTLCSMESLDECSLWGKKWSLFDTKTLVFHYLTWSFLFVSRITAYMPSVEAIIIIRDHFCYGKF